MYIYGQFGIRLPHGATDQMRYGTAVDRSQLQPGDLIFFHDDYYSSSTASHCGIYVGNDQFVHASTYGSGGVLLTALNGNPYYSAHYIAAGAWAETMHIKNGPRFGGGRFLFCFHLSASW